MAKTNQTEKTVPSDNKDDLNVALRVFQTEIDGLEALKKAVGPEFSEAVQIIQEMKEKPLSARLIVAGIGKSGHVARKIAATLASTGTPAYFVHPGEASHGDLGMITENDVVLMLSNSGENPELSDLIHYTRRYDITLIALTSKKDSALAQHSDVCLLMPKAPEACPNGLAPTTSTTMMMAYGDALAVALLERMGLTREQFKAFHPGGKLGQKLLKVSDLMIPRAEMSTVKIESQMDAAILALTEKNLGAVVVLDENDALAGIVTDGDLKRHMSPDLLQKPVVEIMSVDPRTISHTALGVEAVDKMTKTAGRYVTSLLVMDGENLVGMIRLQDCLKAGLV